MNFDGAYDIRSAKASIGGLARDHFGNLVVAFTCEVWASHPLEVELLALQTGLQHLTHLTMTSLEGDCLVLVTSIKNSGHLSANVEEKNGPADLLCQLVDTLLQKISQSGG